MLSSQLQKDVHVKCENTKVLNNLINATARIQNTKSTKIPNLE